MNKLNSSLIILLISAVSFFAFRTQAEGDVIIIEVFTSNMDIIKQAGTETIKFKLTERNESLIRILNGYRSEGYHLVSNTYKPNQTLYNYIILER